MANAPINKPRLYTSQGTTFPAVQVAAYSDGSNSFEAQTLVKIASGVLAAYVADDTAVVGLTPDASKTSTAEPFNALYGENHNPIALRGQQFIMNITNAAGDVGSGSTTQADVSLGLRYSGVYFASPYTTTLGLDASDVGTATKNIFKVVGLYNSSVAVDGDASTDPNGRVIVEIIESAIQTT